MTDLRSQLETILNEIKKNNPNEEYLDADQLKDIFLNGFAKLMQIDIEKFYNFTIERCNDPNNLYNVKIQASLKNNMTVDCLLEHDFLLSKNIAATKSIFGEPENMELLNSQDGIAEIKNNIDD